MALTFCVRSWPLLRSAQCAILSPQSCGAPKLNAFASVSISRSVAARVALSACRLLGLYPACLSVKYIVPFEGRGRPGCERSWTVTISDEKSLRTTFQPLEG